LFIRVLPIGIAALSLLAVTATIGSASAAQPAPEPVPSEDIVDETVEEEIVVVGGRPRGAVISDVPPENQLGPRDIRATGATSIGELLQSIAPQTSSARGREGGAPVVLLNGRRISGFREVRDLPPEAIERVDILPEEVALSYGYRADQRVVNIVLRPRFRSTTARIEGGLATEGGRGTGEADATRLLIGEDSRTSLNLHLEAASALTEDERDIAIAGPGVGATDPRPFRTLVGESRLARVGGTVSRPLFGASTTIDGQIERSDGRSLLGPSLIEFGTPLERDTDARSGRLGVAMNGEDGRWRWSLTSGVEASKNRTLTDREDGATPVARRDRARSTSSTATLELVANGPLVEVPAGRASATFKLGGDTRNLDSRTRRGLVETASDLGRDRLASSVSVDVPVAGRRGGPSGIGTLSANANLELETLSDFGRLTTYGGGLFWSPVSAASLIVSYTREEGAPGLQQLGDPLLVTPNARIFDFRRGATALVDSVTGGNPALRADDRQVLKLGGTLKPFDETDIELRADYVRTRVDDPVSRFPGPTAAIEAAFPDRFVRDAAGQLVRVDLRPVNFESATRDEFRWGVNFSKPLRSRRPPQVLIDQLRGARRLPEGGGVQEGPPRPPGDGRFGGRRSGGGPFGGRGGRLTLSAYHTLALQDEVMIRRGLPVLDYLDGEAIDGGGGRARHRIEVETGYFNNGLGARLSADWRSGSEVVGGPSGDLEFEPLGTVDLRLFANLGERFELVAKYPWLRGVQVRLGIDNLFDAKQRVRDGAGLTPINYQPDLIDPQGRTVTLSLRKLFVPARLFRRAR
jgi:hypothetical protein